MRLRSLSLFVVLHTVSDRSRYCDIEAIINVDLLSAMPTALVGSVDNDFLDKLMHDIRSKLRDTLILRLHQYNLRNSKDYKKSLKHITFAEWHTVIQKRETVG